MKTLIWSTFFLFIKVYLFDDSLTEYANITDNNELGTYFGHALAVSDFNNDGQVIRIFFELLKKYIHCTRM